MSQDARERLEVIRRLAARLERPLRVLNVCGGHERALTQAGLRSLLGPQFELIPGPGCPVCVCPEADLRLAIQWALELPLTLAAFGDMLDVPINGPRSAVRSLQAARAAGADVAPIAGPADALALARARPERTVVLHAVGFETTLAPIAALLAEGLPPNLLLLTSGRLTWPAVALLLESGESAIDALVAPGHVATVMGPRQWSFVPERHGLPTAVAGFTAGRLLAAIESLLRQHLDGEARLVNCYAGAVREQGNPRARQLLKAGFERCDAPWRGIGTLPGSGLRLREALAAHDARRQLPAPTAEASTPDSDMPPGCDCARVVLGRIRPPQCRLYGTACRPRTPIGPCMVSSEGACRIWWDAGVRGPRGGAGGVRQEDRARQSAGAAEGA